MDDRDEQAALFDIEGTVLPITFVSEVLFPAALQSLPSYVEQHWSEPRGDFADIKARFPEIATSTPDAFVSYCIELNSKNSKFPPWKTLQGILWRQLYQDGTVKAPLYDDVLPALNSLKEARVKIYIYSSGSIEAQKLLFAHTNRGDIRALIDGYFDPSFLRVESKFDVEGYESIISQTGIRHWTFFSDVPNEVVGAKQAGMNGYVVFREGNNPLSDMEIAEHQVLHDGFHKILDLTQR